MSLTASDIDRITRLVQEDLVELERQRASFARGWPTGSSRTDPSFLDTHGAYTERIVHDARILFKLQLMREA